jgi:osmotically-inducible protein OsmY
MSHASYAVYQFTDSFEVSEALSDALVAIEIKNDASSDFSDDEVDEMLGEGMNVLDTLVAYYEGSYDGENTIIAELANRLVAKEYSQDEAKNRIEECREDLNKEDFQNARATLLEIQNVVEKISDRKYENAVFV